MRCLFATPAGPCFGAMFRVARSVLLLAPFVVVVPFPRAATQLAASEPLAATRLASHAASLVSPTASLAEAIAQAKSQLQPLPAVAPAKAALQARVSALDAYLQANGANGQAWRAYLKWNDLVAQLAAPTPNAATLRAVADQFFDDHVGLEQPIFHETGLALRRYLAAVESAAVADFGTERAAHLEALATAIEAYRAAPSEEGALEVGEQLVWLEERQQAQALLASVRGQLSYPNLYAQVSGEIVTAGLNRRLNDVAPLQDTILGTCINGSTHTQARVHLQLVPCADYACFETVFTGTAWSNTVGVNGPAIICAQGVTGLAGRKCLLLSEHGLSAGPATACADTHTCITGISSSKSGVMGRVVVRVASKRAAQQKPQAEEIGSRHAEARLRSRLDNEVATQLAKSNENYWQKFRAPLLRVDSLPSVLRFSTTQTDLNVVSLQANAGQLGAPTAPPELPGDHELTARVHESLFNNAAASVLGSRTLNDEQMRAKIIEYRGSLPDKLKDDPDQEPWSITFDERRPVSVHVGDNEFEVTIRGSGYTSGDRVYKAMNVTAVYGIERGRLGVRLVRKGDLRIFPPGFVEGRDRFSVQQQALRSILQKKFGKMFEPEIKGEGLSLPGKWEQAGKLWLAEISAGHGWLTLAWDRGAEPLPEASAAAHAVAAPGEGSPRAGTAAPEGAIGQGSPTQPGRLPRADRLVGGE